MSHITDTRQAGASWGTGIFSAERNVAKKIDPKNGQAAYTLANLAGGLTTMGADEYNKRNNKPEEPLLPIAIDAPPELPPGPTDEKTLAAERRKTAQANARRRGRAATVLTGAAGGDDTLGGF